MPRVAKRRAKHDEARKHQRKGDPAALDEPRAGRSSKEHRDDRKRATRPARIRPASDRRVRAETGEGQRQDSRR